MDFMYLLDYLVCVTTSFVNVFYEIIWKNIKAVSSLCFCPCVVTFVITQWLSNWMPRYVWYWYLGAPSVWRLLSLFVWQRMSSICVTAIMSSICVTVNKFRRNEFYLCDSKEFCLCDCLSHSLGLVFTVLDLMI